MKILETSTAPNPRRVRMFMAEKGLLNEAEFVQIDLQKGENLTPEYAVKNPMKKVPVMELDDGNCIAETMAICRYFEKGSGRAVAALDRILVFHAHGHVLSAHQWLLQGPDEPD
jgi:glutathione S-transferase